MNKEVVLGFHSLARFPQSLISHTVSVDVKHHEGRRRHNQLWQRLEEGAGKRYLECVRVYTGRF